MSKPIRVLIVEDSENDALLLVRELRRGRFEPEFERVDTPESMTAAVAKGAAFYLTSSPFASAASGKNAAALQSSLEVGL